MEDIIQHGNQLYISAASALADSRTRVLKTGEAFGIFDVFGDIKPIGSGAHGLYHGATRYISKAELFINNRYPLYLSSTITGDNRLLTADLTNSDIVLSNGQALRKGTLHIFREKFLTDNGCQEKIHVTNFGEETCAVDLTINFASDFADIFEIRGMKRTKRGKVLDSEVGNDFILNGYDGLDQIRRQCRIQFDQLPNQISANSSQFTVEVAASERKTLSFKMECLSSDEPTPEVENFEEALRKITERQQRDSASDSFISCSSERFTTWFNRSRADIRLMVTDLNTASYPYAGIPWFNTVFGRDGIITALQYLWVNTDIARGVLTFLSKYQAQEDNPYQDAEPGKILHELRKGEMVETGEVPFKTYYGSADSTPLYIILAGQYFQWTNDILFIEKLWPSVMKAIEWIDNFGDLDGDGFVEYQRRSKNGLANQGWKDSHDSISHADGKLAQGSIALCEVQGYVYMAKLNASIMAKSLGFLGLSDQLSLQARNLKERFHKSYWNEDLGMYSVALDGEKKPCEVRTSNSGHCLFTGIASDEAAQRMGKTLFSEEMFSGWGIRTLSDREVRYNPMSYHNGSIWPHDNSLIAEGFAKYRMKREVSKLTSAFFEGSVHMDLFRMPELFCGFQRRTGEGPTLYPVACLPQAWAAGSVFMLLKASLGLSIDGKNDKINFYHPTLPPLLSELRIHNLKTPRAEVDLLLRRHGQEVSVFVERREGNVEINTIQ